MTPAIDFLKKNNFNYQLHEYSHTANAQAYGLEAAEKLNVDSALVFKTLVVMLEAKQLAVAIVPVNNKLNLKLLAKGMKAKKAQMADKQSVEKSTGYILGGVSPIAQKKKLPTLIDLSAKGKETIFISAGKRGLEIEISPSDLLQATSADFIKLCE